MPKRTDIHSILIIGSGPIVIGQGCEFDYSGVQACRALKEEGFRVVLINSNPATIMTDPEFADATYIEPIGVEAVEKILKAREGEQGTPVDALLPTLGGQTGLNTGMACFDQGILTKYGVQMIGADREAIFKGEDRQVFKDLMIKHRPQGAAEQGRSRPSTRRSEALKQVEPPRDHPSRLHARRHGRRHRLQPRRIRNHRPSRPRRIARRRSAHRAERSSAGKSSRWKSSATSNDNAIIICSIENLDAMGVHTGDSITVAPIQTLTDKEYQRMRDASLAVIRAVGVETGGSQHPVRHQPREWRDGRHRDEPARVAQSSALASKATGYPIAKIAAKLAVGYTLDELPNPITTRKRPKISTRDENVALVRWRSEALSGDPKALSGELASAFG